MRHKAVAFLLLLLSAVFATGFSESDGKEVVHGKLGRRIQSILASKKLHGAVVGVKVVSLAGGETVYQLNAGRLFSVASNMKLATTAAALVALGAEHRLSATLYRRGRIDSGVLKGDLVIVGLGDTCISGRFHGGNQEAVLDSWAALVRSLGMTRVEGNIVADSTAYGPQMIPPGWPRNQLDKWYCAPVSALSINDNCFDITISPGAAPGRPAAVSVRPRADVMKFANSCTTTSKKKKHFISIIRKPGTNQITVKGAFWQGSGPQSFNITVHDPPLVFAGAFASALKRQGITVSGKVVKLAEPVSRKGLVPVAQHSILLATAISIANKRSQNLHAEIILRELGRGVGSGTRASGIKSVVNFFKSFGVPEAQVSPADGCGLDSNTKLSPAAIVALLKYMHSRPDYHVFKESLAVSGHDGTLKKRLNRKPFAGKVHAKTGYIAGASALSGYATDAAGQKFAFSIVFNNARKLSNSFMKGVQDEIVSAIVESR